jgi:hypothetical protein
MAVRTLLTSPTVFYCGTGSTFGSLTGLTPDFPTVQAAANNLYNNIDCGGQPVEIRILDGSVDPGFRFSGLLVGQRGLSGVVVRCSALGAAVIRPSGGGACVALDSGALISIAEFQMDCATQAAASTPQDVIQLGQAAHIALWGSNRIIQNSYSYNGITLVGCSTLDIEPQSWGSAIQNGGHLYIQGQYQDFIQTDQGSNVEADCNGQHGLVEIHCETSSYRSRPYWAVAFADPASGVMVLSGVDFGNGTGADGYRYRIRKGATLDLNLVQDPNQVTALPGSASTAWPVQGYLI